LLPAKQDISTSSAGFQDLIDITAKILKRVNLEVEGFECAKRKLSATGETAKEQSHCALFI